MLSACLVTREWISERVTSLLDKFLINCCFKYLLLNAKHHKRGQYLVFNWPCMMLLAYVDQSPVHSCNVDFALVAKLDKLSWNIKRR